ncbi:hypothetical protein [Actinoplanes sp. NPDC026670]|uniref:hypothetical protein n=1 Tax=Actinoplanes sp. NPDC026670 TaxID=3154700 RepID=UPI0033D173D4
MGGLLSGFILFSAGVIGAVVGDMVSDEVRQRLDRLPLSLIRLCCRRLPEPIRSDRADEWSAELAAILAKRGSAKLPITRLVVGVRFALGLVTATPALRRAALTRRGRTSDPRLAVTASAVIAIASILPILAAVIGTEIPIVIVMCGFLVLTARIILAAVKHRNRQSWFAVLALLPFAAFGTLELVVNWLQLWWLDSVVGDAAYTAVATALLLQPFLAYHFIATLRPAPGGRRVLAVGAVFAVINIANFTLQASEGLAIAMFGCAILLGLVGGILTMLRSFWSLGQDLRFQQMLNGMAATLSGIALTGLTFGISIELVSWDVAVLAGGVAATTAAFAYLAIVAPPKWLRVPWAQREEANPATP